MWRPDMDKASGSDAAAGLASPMTSRPYQTEGKGGNQPGDKDAFAATVALGQPTPSTAGGPVGFQVTEDTQNIAGKSGSFPSGTAIRG
jgi:hypothetical protein